MQVDIKVENNIAEVMANLKDRKKAFLSQGKDLMVAEIKLRTPVLTGFLRNSITGQDASENEVVAGSGCDYAKAVNYGLVPTNKARHNFSEGGASAGGKLPALAAGIFG